MVRRRSPRGSPSARRPLAICGIRKADAHASFGHDRAREPRAGGRNGGAPPARAAPVSRLACRCAGGARVPRRRGRSRDGAHRARAGARGHGGSGRDGRSSRRSRHEHRGARPAHHGRRSARPADHPGCCRGQPVDTIVAPASCCAAGPAPGAVSAARPPGTSVPVQPEHRGALLPSPRRRRVIRAPWPIPSRDERIRGSRLLSSLVISRTRTRSRPRLLA